MSDSTHTTALADPFEANDVRAAIGALTHRCRSIEEKLTEVARNVERLAFLAQVLDEFRSVLDNDLPEALDKLANDPILGAIIGPYADLLKTSVAGGLQRARALNHR